jgi:tRNA G18 (ribose-2'-O)-methylase SpoU
MHNIGAFFRTCDAAGVDFLHISGYSAKPPRKEISKVAIGAENYVPWSYDENPIDIINRLKKEGFKIVLLEQVDGSINSMDWRDRHNGDDVLLILGSELHGACDELIEIADEYMEIPMHGQKASLNVSVAFGIAIYSIIKK